jgi:hypothetical protein
MRSKKNDKLTPHYQTELDGESEKNNRFVPRELLFLTKIRFLEKNDYKNQIQSLQMTF